MLTPASFFDLQSFEHTTLFQGCAYVWDGLKNLKNYMHSQRYPTEKLGGIATGIPLVQNYVWHNDELIRGEAMEIEFGDATKGKLKVTHEGKVLEGASVIMAGSVLVGGQVIIGKGVLIEAGALIKGPTIIGDCTEVRQGAYLRGYCLTGKRCVVGHVTEVKHSVFMDDAKAGHFAYLGDTILGNDVNLGAGTKMANLRFMSGDVQIRTKEGYIATGLRKFGAILGDKVQTGCNSVTNPGTVLGKKSIVFPNTTVPSGYHQGNSIIR